METIQPPAGNTGASTKRAFFPDLGQRCYGVNSISNETSTDQILTFEWRLTPATVPNLIGCFARSGGFTITERHDAAIVPCHFTLFTDSKNRSCRGLEYTAKIVTADKFENHEHYSETKTGLHTRTPEYEQSETTLFIILRQLFFVFLSTVQHSFFDFYFNHSTFRPKFDNF